MHRAACRLDALQTGDHPRGQILRREAAARGGHIAVGDKGLVQHIDAGFLDPGLRGQVRAGGHVVEQAASATTSRVCIPLPTMTASAALASLKVAWASSTTPFIDRTRAVGLAIDTRQSAFLTRLRMPSAMSESSSLKRFFATSRTAAAHTSGRPWHDILRAGG